MEDNHVEMALRSDDEGSSVFSLFQSHRLREAKLANEVFSQDLLLEKILKYAIHQNDESSHLSRPTIRSTRLVQKRWLQTVTKLVGKEKEPLFKLSLNRNNSTSGTEYVRENGKLLNQFVDSFSMTSSSGYVPTFSVMIMEPFFRQENLASFSNFLRRCGRGLLEMEMFVPLNGGSLPGLLSPRLSLPLLDKLTVHCTQTKLESLSRDETIFMDSDHITYLLFALLNCAPKLTVFQIPFTQRRDLPSNFQSLLLPASLTKLTLSNPGTCQNLQVLTNNSLPNLSQLDLTVPNVSSDGEYLSSALDSVRTSLQKLSLRGIDYEGPPREITLLRLPIMEKLRIFHLLSINCELDPRTISSLERFLPRMEKFSMRNQTVEMFQEWTATSKYPSVTRVALTLVDEDEFFGDDNYVLSLNLENMQKLHMAFPNVQNLRLEISPGHTCGLKYMFMEMRQLVVLKIRVALGEEWIESDYWDSVLTGTTLAFIAGLRESPDFWELVDIKNENMPSLRMLEDLTTLTLETDDDPVGLDDDSDDGGMPALNSDLLFHLALLKMPKLKNLTFKGRFVASNRVRELCQAQNKNLVL